MVLFDGVEEILQRWRGHNEYSKDLVTLATSIGIFAIVVVAIKLLFSTIRGKLT